MIRKIIILVVFLVQGILLPANSISQEAKVNRKKIEREHLKKEREAKKAYDKKVKQHFDIQTKETQKRMKQTKKEAKKNTPLK